MLEEKSASCLNQVTILVLSHPILLRSVNIRRLMKNIPCDDEKEEKGAERYSKALSLRMMRIEMLN